MAKKLELLSGNYEEIQVTALADLSAGDLETIGNVNGFPLIDVDTGIVHTMIKKAEKVKAEKTAAGIDEGVPVYWVNATKNVANAGDILIGHAYEAAAAADTHIVIVFDGFAAFLKA